MASQINYIIYAFMRLSLLRSISIYLMCIVLVLFSYTPYYNHVLIPDIILLIVFCILTCEVSKVSIFPFFIIGLLQDYIIGGVIGITPLKVLFVMLVIYYNYKAFLKQKFNIKWIGFMILTLCCIAIQLFSQYVMSQGVQLNTVILAQYLFTVFSFPLIYLLVYRFMAL